MLIFICLASRTSTRVYVIFRAVFQSFLDISCSQLIKKKITLLGVLA